MKKKFLVLIEDDFVIMGNGPGNVAGLRHHYWHMGKDQLGTLRMHKAAGFEYDSSIAFNDHMGFRRNIALPYFTWDDTNERMINVIQLPVFCMDGNLFYHPMEDVDVVKD